jgi:serine protease Do
MHGNLRAARAAVCAAAWALLAGPVAATEIEDQSRALQRAREAVVGLEMQAVENARSAATLGPQRRGSGVLIGSDGLVLTIGYLVLEAERIEIVTDEGRRVPARVVAYDQATGFGLVQALLPLGNLPVPLGDPSGPFNDTAAMVVSGGEDGEVSPVRLLSRRAFSGFWEYHVEGALFTAPPAGVHSGAGLFNGRGELLGVGSLVVADALGPGQPRTAGNMFVPVDLLKPILAELRQRGLSQASVRDWMGVNCVEQEGQVRVVRVTDDSPADVAGLQAGDRITRLDGVKVAALAQLWKALWADSRSERTVLLEIERGGRPMNITVHTVDRAKTLRRAQGI